MCGAKGVRSSIGRAADYRQVFGSSPDDTPAPYTDHGGYAMDIHYRFFENPICEARVKGITESYTYLLPPWLHSLNVDSSSAEEDEAVACTHIKHEYGLATILIYPLFWEQHPSRQQLHILHEILHVAHGRILNLVQHRLLNHLKEANPDLHMFCEYEFTERLEEFIENLAQAITEHTTSG